MRLFRVILLFACPAILGACAFGQRIDYRGSSNFATPATDEAVTVGVQDERPYVVNGNKEPNFVGLQRSLYGIPYSVTTTSGSPLADEIGSLVVGAINQKTTIATQIKIPVATSSESRNALFGSMKSARAYFIEIREWETDTYFKTTLTHDVSLSVMNSAGTILATKNSIGEETLGSRADRANLATSISSIFGTLVNDPVIVAASKGSADSPVIPPLTPPIPPIPPTPPTPPNSGVSSSEGKSAGCSVDQVLDMQKAGLSEERIRAACK